MIIKPRPPIFRKKIEKEKNNFSYERLEFLGDRVLSLVIAHNLFLAFSNEDEGALSKRHSDLVSKEKLLEVANELNIKLFLRSDAAEKKYIKIQKNNSILSDVCEALIGAIFLDSNINEAKKFIQKYWKEKIYKNILPPKDAKSTLQEIAQKKGLPLPKYKLKSKINKKLLCSLFWHISSSGLRTNNFTIFYNINDQNCLS